MKTLAESFKYLSNEREQRQLKERHLLILLRVQGVYADVFDELERASPDADERRHRLLSNLTFDLDGFIAGMERLQEARV